MEPESAEKPWPVGYVALVIVLVAVSVAQMVYMLGLFSSPVTPPDRPAESASKDAPTTASQQLATPPAQPPTGGRLLVPPRVLFAGLIAVQKDPQARLSPSQAAEVKKKLEVWCGLNDDMDRRVLPAVAIELAALSGPQRDYLRQVQQDGKASPGPQWIATFDMLEARARTRSATPEEAVPRPTERDAQPFMRFSPQVITTALTEMDKNPALRLTPAQAKSVLPPLRAWKAKDDEYMALMVAIGEVLDARQKAVIERIRQDPQTAQQDPKSPKDVLPLLDERAQ